MNRRTGVRASILGIDGSGKSTAANTASLLLSEAYPDTPVQVVDSTGLAVYRGGEPHSHQFARLEQLKTTEAGLSGKLSTGLFTAARQLIELKALQQPGAITVGVRDPFRVDLAAHLPNITSVAGKLSPEQRFSLFHALTVAPHPDHIAHIEVDPHHAYHAAKQRGTLEPHETPDAMHAAANDLQAMTQLYKRRHGVPFSTIQGLQPTTADELAATLEPLVAKARKK